MRIVLQRVSIAQVTVDGETVGKIERGWLALVGIAPGDTHEDCRKLAEKTAVLRAFPDADGKMNLSVADIGGGVLAVSNFTLYADCRKGRRPSFVDAASPEIAEPIYQEFIRSLRALGIPTEQGRFGADMHITLTNEGQVTIILQS